MPKYKIVYPKGEQGGAERLPERLAQVGVTFDAKSGVYSTADETGSATLEYLNAIAGEYGGVFEEVGGGMKAAKPADNPDN